MQPSSKPSVPREVYKFLILYYTIVDYVWIGSGSKECKRGILKPGWFPIKVFNYTHPLMKASMERVRKEQELCLKNKEINLQRLSEMVINI